MNYKYYNQNNYGNVPYPSSALPKATVKSGGCGVCCASMIVENLTTHKIGPQLMAQYSINKRARVSGGTDMNVLAKAISADYGMEFSATSDESALLNHLQAGGMAVVNVGGNRNGYIGVFSDGGHYIVAAGLTSDGKVIILDPGYYVGKFNKTGRTGKVKMNGNYCICDMSVLAEDTASKTPAYWLFKLKGGITMAQLQEWMPKAVADAKAAGLIKSDHDPLEVVNMATLCAMMLNLMNVLKGGR